MSTYCNLNQNNHYQELIEIKPENHFSKSSSSSLSSLSDHDFINRKNNHKLVNNKLKKVRFKKKFKKHENDLNLDFNQNEFDPKQAKNHLSQSLRLIFYILALIGFTFYTLSIFNFHTKLNLLSSKVNLLSKEYNQMSKNINLISSKIIKSESYLSNLKDQIDSNQVGNHQNQQSQNSQKIEALSFLLNKVQSLEKALASLQVTVNELKSSIEFKNDKKKTLLKPEEFQTLFAKIINKEEELEEKLNLTMNYVQTIHDEMVKQSSHHSQTTKIPN